eukprot:1332904-Rhodomonas_salina.2
MARQRQAQQRSERTTKAVVSESRAKRRILTVDGGSEACLQGGLNDEECPGCLEEWANIAGTVVMLPCRHIVCGPCMLRWAQGCKEGFAADEVHEAVKHLPPTCPCCRAVVVGGLRAIESAITAVSASA